MAYIAGRLISGKSSSAVYDYSERGYTSYTGTVDTHAVSVYRHRVDNQGGAHPDHAEYANYHEYGPGSAAARPSCLTSNRAFQQFSLLDSRVQRSE